MENEKSEHVSTRAVAGATRMPSDATDDDEVRERGVVLEFCVHCGQPNPVVKSVVSRRSVTEAHLPRAPAVPGSHRSSPGDHGGGLGSRRTVPGQQGVRGRNPRGGEGDKQYVHRVRARYADHARKYSRPS